MSGGAARWPDLTIGRREGRYFHTAGNSGQTARGERSTSQRELAAEKSWVRACRNPLRSRLLLRYSLARTILFKHLPPAAVRFFPASHCPTALISPGTANAAALRLATWSARPLFVWMFRRLIRRLP